MSASAPIPGAAAEVVKVTALKPHPSNPRRGSVATIVESLKEHGQYRPIVAQRSTGYIIAGNHTWQAAKELGWKEIAVTYVDVDDAQARRILLVDNRSSDLGIYDDEQLYDLLKSTTEDYGSLLGTGYDQPALDDLAAILEESLISGDEEVVDGIRLVPSLPDQALHYAEKAQRVLLMTVPNAVFAWANESMAKIAAARGMPEMTNTDVVMMLISEAIGEPIPTVE
jgi:ParB-like chromosome segregation protein Spo0J